MILPQGSNAIPIGEPIDIQNTEFYVYSNGDPEFNPNSYAVRVQRLTHQAFHNCNPNVSGLLAYYYLDYDCVLCFWPTADKEYYARFSFNPPRKTI